MGKISSDLIRGHIDTIILYSLSDGDKSVQDIIDDVSKKSDSQYKINQATLYSSLKRLENSKQIKSYWHDAPTGGRRKYFKITEKGKISSSNELENLNFSREIIDKIMDISPTHNQKIEFIPNNFVENQHKTEIIENNPITPIIEVPINEAIVKNNENDVIKNEIKVENIDNSAKIEEKKPKDIPVEINFRNVLNDIRKKQIKTIREEKPILVEKENIDIKQEKVSISEVLSKDNSTVNIDEKIDLDSAIQEKIPTERVKIGLKIDFSDIVYKGKVDGYKVRISSKTPKSNYRTVFINLVNLFSSLVMFAFVLLEFLIIISLFSKTLNMNPGVVVGIIFASLVLPIIFLIFTIRDKNKTSGPIRASSVFGSLIIFFDLSIIIFALCWFLGLNFDDTKNVIVCFVLPLLICFDFIVFMISRYYLSKVKFFNKIYKAE